MGSEMCIRDRYTHCAQEAGSGCSVKGLPKARKNFFKDDFRSMTNFKTFWESLKKIFLPLTEQTGSATLAHGIRRGRHTERPGSGRRECEKKPPDCGMSVYSACIWRQIKPKPLWGLGFPSAVSLTLATAMPDVHVKVARRVKKNFPDTHYRPENFFALTCASGMAQNTDGISPLWELSLIHI